MWVLCANVSRHTWMSQVSFVRDNGAHQTKEGYRGQNPVSKKLLVRYGVATISRLLKMIGLFCKRALYKRSYSAKETYHFMEPTNRSHPIGHACDTTHSYMSDTTHSYMTGRICTWHDSFTPGAFCVSPHSSTNGCCCHIWTSHVTYEWITLHTNASRHMWMSHVSSHQQWEDPFWKTWLLHIDGDETWLIQ